MPPAHVVIDASVAVQWVVSEVDSDKAILLLGNRLIAPDLICAEFCNALWKKAHRGEIGQDEAAEAVASFPKAGIVLVGMQAFLEAALAIARELRHPPYDCFYLALAQSAGLPFVTADGRLLRKIAGTPWSTRVVALADAPSLA